MTETEQQEVMMRRVRKLLALAEKAGSEEEAAAATAKATDLMLRYAIDEAMLSEGGDERAKTEKIVARTVTVQGYARPKLHMMHRVGEAMGLKTVEYTNSRRGWSTGTGQVVGFESDVAAFEVLFASLNMQATTEADRAFADYQARGGWEHGRSFKQAFFISFGSTVASRIRQQRQVIVAETDAATPGTALAVVNRDEMVVSEFNRMHPDLQKGTGMSSGGASGHHAGRAAGQRANIGGNALGGSRGALNR